MTLSWRSIAAALAVLALSLPAILPLTSPEYFRTDDGPLHIYRLVGLADALRQGIVFPRLFPAFAYEYGTPVLNHYGPLAYYVAVLPQLFGASIVACWKWALAFGFVASGGSMYVLARRFVPILPALTAAAAYVYFPYHLMDVYARGALAEHIAWIFPPLILWTLTPATETLRELPRTTQSLLPRADAARMAWGAALTAALVLTHPVIAMMFLPFGALYGAAMCRAASSVRRVAMPLAALGGGIALSAFYWLPAIAEGGWVLLTTMAEGDFAARHYEPFLIAPLNLIQASLFYDYDPPPGMARFSLGLISALALGWGAMVLGFAWRRKDARARPLALFVLLAIAALFMQSALSLPLWRDLTRVLAFVQFPWRFMVPAALGIAMVAALSLRPLPMALLALPVFAVSAIPGVELTPAPLPAASFNAMWRDEFTFIALGTAWHHEYLSRWVQAGAQEIPRPSQRPVSEVVTAPPSVRPVSVGYTRRSYRFDSSAPAALSFHRFYLPSWQVRLDGTRLPTYPSGDLGLLSVTVPPTQGGTLELEFGPSRATLLGMALSTAAALGFAIAMRSRKVVAVVVCGAVLGAALGLVAMPRETIAQEVHADFEDSAALIGVASDKAIVAPGDSIQVTLIWVARRPFDEDIRVFLHAEQDGRRLAQSDGDPVHLYTPTSRWQAGELVEDTRTLRIPADAGSGTVRLFAGMYRTNPMRNLTVTQDGRIVPDGRATAGTFAIEAVK